MTCQVIPLRPRRTKRAAVPVPGKWLMFAVPAVISFTWLLALPGMPHTQQQADSAEEFRRSFAVSPGELRPALEKFARQAGIRLAFDPASVSGLTTPGLQGRYTVQDGLNQLLRGTGYQGSPESGRYVLVPEPSTSAEKRRPPVAPRLAVTLIPA